MSSGFRDSFTKEDTKEDLLGYDDTAWNYFLISVLTCIAIPWTCSLIYGLVFLGDAAVEKGWPRKNASGTPYRYCQTSAMVDKVDLARKAKRCTTSSALCWIVRGTFLSALWAGIAGTFVQLGDEKEIKKFDPFDILDVTPQAAGSEIKRAYRKLSLIYHPDKNPDDPLAASRFIQITKAYQALTDEIAKRNWEKYGNPDGPQTTKVGIGLPRFLLEKEHNLSILCAFFFVIIIAVPMTFICYSQHTKNFAANGVMIETLQFLGYYISESTRVKNCPELMAACAESRGMPLRPTDNAHIKKLDGKVCEHKKRLFTLPVVMKNQYLLWAHMQRHHQLLTDSLRNDVDELLRHSMKITQAMIEIACMREWFATAQAMIEFRRCLVQALDVKSSQLLQIPHFQEEHLELCRAEKVTTMAEFMALAPDERKKLCQTMEPDKWLDVEAFCSHICDVELKANLAVEDEGEFVVGDIATVTVQMKRGNLQQGEASGPVHAPWFPEAKFEEWWFFLVEATSNGNESKPSTKIIHFERLLDSERFLEEKLRFQVTNPGENNLVLHALCDAYAGIDKRVDLAFHAYAEEELKRQVPSHEEDEELDQQPTLFQQWMGLLHEQDESEEEDEDGTGAATAKRRLATSPPLQGREEKSRTEDGKNAGHSNDGDAGEDTADSSSDSD